MSLGLLGPEYESWANPLRQGKVIKGAHVVTYCFGYFPLRLDIFLDTPFCILLCICISERKWGNCQGGKLARFPVKSRDGVYIFILVCICICLCILVCICIYESIADCRLSRREASCKISSREQRQSRERAEAELGRFECFQQEASLASPPDFAQQTFQKGADASL